MAIYAKPLHSAQEVNAAGKALAHYFSDASVEMEVVRPYLDVLDNFRASHSYPLNAFSMTLKNRIRGHSGAFVAQRIKRLGSIAVKLLDRKNMKLTQMQDIGGCRAVLPNLKQVLALRDLYLARGGKHQFLGEKDYIFEEPQATGYRGMHLKYRYQGTGSSEIWNGLKIEVQLRTLNQHRWATAVEAAGTFTKSALKSNRGRQEWLRFFALMGSVYAAKESCPPIPGAPAEHAEVRTELQALNAEFHIQKTFAHYRTIIPQIEKIGDARYFLVTLDPVRMNVGIRSYTREQSQLANRDYTEAEVRAEKTTNVVLVSMDSVKALQRAYPNYFLDTDDFMRDVAQALG